MPFKNNTVYDHMRVVLAYLDEQNEAVALTRLLYVCNNAKGGFPIAIRKLVDSNMIKKVPSSYRKGSYAITPKGHKALELFNIQAGMIKRYG